MAEYDEKGGYGAGYGKRPMWQWILLYIVIGGILYYGVYYYFLKDNYDSSSYDYSTQSNDSSGSIYDYGTDQTTTLDADTATETDVLDQTVTE